MGLMDSSELMSAIGGERFDQHPDGDIIQRFRSDDALDVPIELTDLDLWANYTNENLYVMDKKVREFFKKTRYKRQAKGGYRTTASVVFAWIFGRQPEPPDGYVFRILHELLKYYCTSYTGKTTYQGKPVNRVYRFSKYAVTQKRPYSLRLRLEEAKDGNTAVFRKGPGESGDKRTHGRQPNRKDG